ncbi:MAG: hypothetical protein KDB29_08775 [Planctomycetes bacterium]|nr:hypothetical protein [Planctomycetota bacterium]
MTRGFFWVAVVALVLSGVALVASACSRSASDVVSIDGEYFPEDPEQRALFQLSGDDAAELAQLVEGLKTTEDMKWQGAAVFTITHDDGRKRHVEVTRNDAVRVDGKAFEANTKQILEVIAKHAK